MSLARLKALRSCRRGQTTIEYMLVLGVLAAALVLAFYVIAPLFIDGFVVLVKRIIEFNP
jgi:hypothetical protein